MLYSLQDVLSKDNLKSDMVLSVVKSILQSLLIVVCCKL